MDNTFPEIKDLSSHLFWDVDSLTLDWNTHRKFIVSRVLEYGLLSDWIIISSYYGKSELGRIAASLRNLDSRALSFIAGYTGLAQEKFRCYTTRQSIPQHWKF
jgi:hypothetical protein